MIYQNITELIGKTPVVKLNNFQRGLEANLYVKLEAFNPMSSVKDRLALALIEDGEKRGLITPETTIIEPTSGNTGIGLAFIAAQKGYRLILTMPDTMSMERRKLLAAFGAELILTPGPKGMKGAIAEAEKIQKETPNSYIPGQFDNPANPQMHAQTTAHEIWEDFGKDLHYFVAGVGTGGTITGVAQALKEKNAQIKVVAIEPKESPVISGGAPGPHKLQGIGAGFIPKVLNTKLIDEIIQATDSEAGINSRKLAKSEGILAGISSGAALASAVEIAKRPQNKGKNILVFLPSSGERYLSTWLFE